MFNWNNFSGSLLVRSVYLITLPIVLVQVVGIIIFFELHWDLFLKRSAQSIANEIKILELNKDNEEIDKFAKSAGRITVIDLWSLACEPCLEEFPGLVKLHQTMGDSVQCVAVDVDYDGRKSRPPEYYQKRIVDFLNSVKASGFPTYISKTPSDDVFKTTKLISIPAVMVYNAKGQVVKVFVDTGEDNAFTYEKDVVPFVKSLAG